MVYVLMGVSGAGKTLIGKKLSRKLSIPFYDGDNFHPSSNVTKMKSGQPLNDEDRKPWLKLLAKKISAWNKEGNAILACSALKQCYRDILRKEVAEDDITFIYLKGSKSLIADRISERSGHFMPGELLESQFKALEEPEHCVTVSIDQPPDAVVNSIIRQIKDFKSK